MGDAKSAPVRLAFNPHLRVEFRGATAGGTGSISEIPGQPDPGHDQEGTSEHRVG